MTYTAPNTNRQDSPLKNRSATVITLTAHLKRGDETHQISKKQLWGFLTFLFSFFLVAMIGGGHAWDYQRSSERDKLKAKMLPLAQAGNDVAALWLARNVKGEQYRIEALAAKNIPEALYLQGILLRHEGHAAEGDEMIKKAANLGYADAILRVENIL